MSILPTVLSLPSLRSLSFSQLEELRTAYLHRACELSGRSHELSARLKASGIAFSGGPNSHEERAALRDEIARVDLDKELAWANSRLVDKVYYEKMPLGYGVVLRGGRG